MSSVSNLLTSTYQVCNTILTADRATKGLLRILLMLCLKFGKILIQNVSQIMDRSVGKGVVTWSLNVLGAYYTVG